MQKSESWLSKSVLAQYLKDFFVTFLGHYFPLLKFYFWRKDGNVKVEM